MVIPLVEVEHALEAYKYLVFFPLVVIEGVIATIIAGFLASLGYMNIFLVIAVAVVADMVSDAIYYTIGRHGRKKLLNRWGHLIGIKTSHLNSFEKRFNKHRGKMLFIGKFLPGIDVMSIVGAGVAKVPFKVFIGYVILPSVPKFAFYAFIGYFFGGAYTRIVKGVDNFSLTFLLILALVAAVVAIHKIFLRRLVKKVFGL